MLLRVGDEPVVFVDVSTPVREEVLEEMRRKREERLKGGPERDRQ